MRAHRAVSAIRTCYVSIAILFALTGGALAFPSWMGVYGSYQRHNGVNPGQFTILMNQDYWGLHAEVGIRVNGGSWNTHAMNYVGNTSGNSIWEYKPNVAYATNLTVEYYFHGWDDWGGNIWDSNGGANYNFVAGPAVLWWVGNTWQWPPNSTLKAGDDLWFNAETWTRGSATNVVVLYRVNGSDWYERSMAYAGQSGNNDWWHRYMGRFSVDTEIEYLIHVQDGAGNSHYDLNGGGNFFALVSTGQVVTWLGNAHHWPTNGALTSYDDFWTNIEAYPTNTTVGGYVVYSVNGYVWNEQVVDYNGLSGTNDWWHANHMDMPPGSIIYYLFDIEDGRADWHMYPVNEEPLTAFVAGDDEDSDSDYLPDEWEYFWWGNLYGGGLGNADGDGVTGIPLTDHLEWVIGTDPAVSNRHDQVPLLWFPDRPFRGGVVKLSFSVATNDPIHGGTIFARIDQTDGQGAYDEELLLTYSSGRYEAPIAITTNAGSHVNVVLHNGAGLTNANFSLGWKVPIRDLEVGEAADSDKDGLPDWWEILHGFDPLDDGSIDLENGAGGDPDEDGLANLQEYLAETNPNEFNPAPVIVITYPQDHSLIP